MKKIMIPAFFIFLGFWGTSLQAETSGQQGASSMQWTSSSTSSSKSSSSGNEAVNPFDEMEKMEQSMNRIFQEGLRRIRNLQQQGGGSSFFEPNLDVEDLPDAYLLKMDLPGMEKDDIHIDAANNALTISGNRTLERTEGSKKEGFYRTERSSGSFSRTVPMPADANMDAIKAKYANGVLEITVPKLKKASAAQSTPIPVQ